MDFLPDWFYVQILWGVSYLRLGLSLLIIFSGFLSRRIIQYVFNNYLTKKAKKTTIKWDDDLVALIPAPLALVVQILLWHVATTILILPQEPINIRVIVYQGLEVALAVAAIWVIFRLTDVLSRAMARATEKTDTKIDDQAIPLVRKTIKVFIAITVGVMIIQNLGYSVTSMVASLGIGGLALALAAKDTVANFFGSVVIFTDRPFQIGDWVQFGSVEGTVEEVGFRTTRVRQFDKALVTVPNQSFTSTPIINYTNRSIRRIKMIVGLSYETSSQQMKSFLEAVRHMIAHHPHIDQGFHMVKFTGFGESTLDVLVYCFSDTIVWTDYLSIQEDVLLRIMDIVNDMGLELAFPTQTVYFRDEHWGVIESNN